MSNLDKDRYQKENAIRFCVLSGHVPFLEVNVENQRELSDTSTVITDIDVLGVSIDASGGRRRIIFDCKTVNKMSPINRAFWAAGLMKYTFCNEAFVILKKKASEAHRLSAKQISVHLFDDKQFTNYAESFSLDFKVDYCYTTCIDNWASLEKLYSKAGNFEKFGQFLNNEIPLEKDPSRGVKRLLAALQKGKGEFNPEKAEHLAIFGHTLMTFSFLMSQIIHDLKNIIDFDAKQQDFERLLKYYIWGGKEAFSQRQKMAELFASLKQDASAVEPTLNEWGLFIELVRKMLDSPSDVFKCCFPIRELSFRNIAKKDEAKDLFLAQYIASNNRIRQFVSSQAKYLVKAANLPGEFETELSSIFDELKGKVQ